MHLPSGTKLERTTKSRSKADLTTWRRAAKSDRSSKTSVSRLKASRMESSKACRNWESTTSTRLTCLRRRFNELLTLSDDSRQSIIPLETVDGWLLLGVGFVDKCP